MTGRLAVGLFWAWVITLILAPPIGLMIALLAVSGVTSWLLYNLFEDEL